MRKKQLFFAFLVVLGLCSCSSDDDNSSSNEEDTLIGKWKLISITDEGQLEQASVCESKSIIEFKNDNTFKDIATIESDNSNNCVYDGFGTSGTFTLNNGVLIRTTIDVIAIPDELNNPDWIEEAKGENDPETVSFENSKLTLTEIYEEQGTTFTTVYTYEKTSEDFFSE
ncbi:lipocalin family protein [Fulvivirgaceae bacterium BMA12]|uniref:Lipocalin family protein n=1 Tax=Agaribacillus aureus TaxID=3051825 RepID=A0ABT8L8N4_9BACT|nr:lipocalin family protein [Fulvivirgaceae bacterium BMA12]